MDESPKVNTSREKFFRQYLEILKTFHPYKHLRPKELDVLSELYKYNDQYKVLDYDTRWKLIMHYDTREAIKKKYSISDANFNNILTALRKKNLLIDNKVPEKYLFVVDKQFTFKINFNIAD